MLDKIKFPYFNMQQLNLDWILDRVRNMPMIVQLPLLAGDDYSDVLDMIDYKAQDIPRGVNFAIMGTPEDPIVQQCCCLIYKIDDDNLIGFMLGLSSNIGVNVFQKVAGVWQ